MTHKISAGNLTVCKCPYCGQMSYLIHREKKVFKCFSCGESGPINDHYEIEDDN